MNARIDATTIPRLPLFGWALLGRGRGGELPSLLDRPGVLLTSSGRASILLAVQRLGVRGGQSVLLPSYHCPTMVAPAVHLGARPVFYPIDAQGRPNLEWLDAHAPADTRVLLAAHFFGLPQPMSGLREWCDGRGVGLVEDCAHALFGRSEGRAFGAWGDLAIGSLTKFLPVPIGGCVVSLQDVPLGPLVDAGWRASVRAAVDMIEVAARHGRLRGLNALAPALLDAARWLRHGGAGASAAGAAEASGSTVDVTRTAAIDPVEAGVAMPGLARWLVSRVGRGSLVERRRRTYARLAARLSGHDGLRPLMPDLPDDCAPYVFPLWVDRPDPGYARLRAEAMPVSRWDWLWPGVPRLDGDHGLSWSHHVLQLACHQDMTESDIERLATRLLALYTASSPVCAEVPGGPIAAVPDGAAR